MKEIGTLAELRELVEASPRPLYVRYATEVEIGYRTHHNLVTGQRLPGLRVLRLPRGGEKGDLALVATNYKHYILAYVSKPMMCGWVLTGTELAEEESGRVFIIDDVGIVGKLSRECIHWAQSG